MSAATANPSDYSDEDEEGGLSGLTILGILGTLILVFLVVVYYAYRQGVAAGEAVSSEELPIIAADPRPVAEDVAPAAGDPGRQEVYDRVSGALPSRVVTDVDPAADPLNGYGGAPAQTVQQGAAGPSDEPRPVITARAEPNLTAPAERTVRVPQQKPAPRPAAQASGGAAPQRATSSPSRQTPSRQTPSRQTGSAQPTPASSSATGATSGSHVVQVGAFDSNQAALAYYASLTQRLPDLLRGKAPDVQRVTINERVYYRLRVGPFTAKSGANDYCAKLKASRQDCLVRGV